MASTYSALKIELIGTGEQAGNWGNITNANLGTALEEAIVGRATAAFTADNDLTLTLTNTNASQVARNYILNVTSTTALTTTRNLVVPTMSKSYIIENNTTGGQSILVKTAEGSGVIVTNGQKSFVYVDGTDVVTLNGILSVANGGTGATTLDAAGIVTTATTQTISGDKIFTGSFGITAENPDPDLWPAYAKSKEDFNPAFVFDGGLGPNPICSNFFGGPTSGTEFITVDPVTGDPVIDPDTGDPVTVDPVTVTFAFFGYGASNNNVGQIACADRVNTIYATESDYRLKENVAPMTGALTKVAQLKPVTYTWKSTGNADEGFIAHELQEVIPAAVLGTKDEVYPDGKPKYQSIDTSFIVATLTAAIQEQQALIAELTARVEALEAL